MHPRRAYVRAPHRLGQEVKVKVALRAPYTTLSHEFDGFLFALVGEEQNGMPLSVISALTRLNIDPWGEAAQLARLSNEKAIETLAPIIARLPVGLWTAVDIPAIARRLVDALPRHEVAAQSVATVQFGGKARSRVLYVAFLIILTMVYFGFVARPQPRPDVGATSSAHSQAPR